MLVTLFERCMKRRGVKETDPFDWEKTEENNADHAGGEAKVVNAAVPKSELIKKHKDIELTEVSSSSFKAYALFQITISLQKRKVIPDSVKVMHTEPIESIKPQNANNVNANAKLPNPAGGAVTGQQQNNNNNVQNEKYGVDPLDPRLRQAFKDALIASQEGTKVKVSQRT